MRLRTGFTLIELLVVVTIFGVVLSIVAPLGFQQISRSEAYAELKKIESILKNTKINAFTKGTEIVIKLDGKQLSLTYIQYEETKNFNFDYVFFEKSEFVINSNGFSNASEISAHVNNRNITIKL